LQQKEKQVSGKHSNGMIIGEGNNLMKGCPMPLYKLRKYLMTKLSLYHFCG